MFGKFLFRLLAAVAVLALATAATQAVTIETVPVGNPGNADDTHGDGYGAVDYAYNIGTYEVTAGQYTEFLNEVGGVDTYGLYSTYMWSSGYGCKIERYAGSGTAGDPYQYQVAADYANRPVNYVSWGDAARFANWLHNGQPTGAQDNSTTEDGAYFLNGAMTNAALLAVTRNADWQWALTSEDEWYKAAYHKNDGVTGSYFDYPTSSDTMPGRDLDDVSGNNANYYGDPYPIDDPYYTTIRGEFQDSESPYGTYDQGGNICEWNEAIVSGLYRGLWGGSFAIYGNRMFASYRTVSLPADEYYGHGFRVASIPEPGSITLLVCGLVSLIYWRRRK